MPPTTSQDYTSSAKKQRGPTLALFLGSNISNFDSDEAIKFLRALRRVLSAGDAVLLGADLKKEKQVLEAAYNDALGVTAAFNLNVLARINRELGGEFDLRAFQHRAFYNEEEGRVEIYIESSQDQTVVIRQLEMTVSFARGEMIHTENSYKYALSDLAELASKTGFRPGRTWLDTQKRFSSNLLLAA